MSNPQLAEARTKGGYSRRYLGTQSRHSRRIVISMSAASKISLRGERRDCCAASECPAPEMPSHFRGQQATENKERVSRRMMTIFASRDTG